MLQDALELQTNSKEIIEHFSYLLYYISFDIMHIVLL